MLSNIGFGLLQFSQQKTNKSIG